MHEYRSFLLRRQVGIFISACNRYTAYAGGLYTLRFADYFG